MAPGTASIAAVANWFARLCLTVSAAVGYPPTYPSHGNVAKVGQPLDELTSFGDGSLPSHIYFFLLTSLTSDAHVVTSLAG